MKDDKFKLPRSSYEELSKIIIAYWKENKPANNNDISILSGIGATNISANNAFLIAVGIIEGALLKNITEKGSKLALALEHNTKEALTQEWKTIINDNDFLNKMIQAIGVRKGMDISQLENHIAYSSGETRTKYVMTGSRTIIDILLESGLVQQEGDKILPVIDQSAMPTNTIEMSATQRESQIITGQPTYLQMHTKLGGSGISLHIELRINATPSDLDGLGDKIKDLIKSLSDE